MRAIANGSRNTPMVNRPTMPKPSSAPPASHHRYAPNAGEEGREVGLGAAASIWFMSPVQGEGSVQAAPARSFAHAGVVHLQVTVSVGQGLADVVEVQVGVGLQDHGVGFAGGDEADDDAGSLDAGSPITSMERVIRSKVAIPAR